MTLFQKPSLPIINSCTGVNQSPPSASYMCQWIGSALVQIMAFRLFGTEPLSEPIQGYCQLDSEEQSSVNFSQNTTLSFAKIHLWLPFCPGGLELTQWLLLFLSFLCMTACALSKGIISRYLDSVAISNGLCLPVASVSGSENAKGL